MAAHGYGDKADGGIVRLKPGDHRFENGGVSSVPVVDEWLTITTADGGTVDNTRIIGRTSIPTIKLLRCKGVTLQSPQPGHAVIKDVGTDSDVWVDGCKLLGSGRWSPQSNPIGYGATVWYTDCSITNVDFATPNGVFARGLTIEHIGNDSFQLCPMVVHCTVDDLDPGATGWHGDAWQWYGGGPFNAIVYGLRATGLHYQSVFTRAQGIDDVPPNPPFHGLALVNCYFELADPIYSGGGGGAIRISGDHLVMWHCTFVPSASREHLIGIYNDDFADGAPAPVTITNFSVKGCYFDRLWLNTPGGDVDFSQWDRNHYAHAEPGAWGVAKAFTVTPGTNVTTGVGYLDDFGLPVAGSPLVDRIDPPLVPVDARGTVRAAADVGAYER